MGDLAIGTDFGALQVDGEKHPFRQRSPAFYSIIKNVRLTFVDNKLISCSYGHFHGC